MESIRSGGLCRFIPVGLVLITSNDLLTVSDLIEFFGAGTGSDTSIVLTVSKSFSLSNIGRASSATE